MSDDIESLNIKDTAERLDMSESAIRNYAKVFAVPSFKIATGNKAGERHFDVGLLKVFEQIKQLKSLRLSNSEIRDNIAGELDFYRQRLKDNAPASYIDEDAIVSKVANQLRAEMHGRDLGLLKSFTSELIQAQRDEAGKLQEENAALKAQITIQSHQLNQAKAEAKALPAAQSEIREAEKSRSEAIQSAQRYQKQLNEANEALRAKADALDAEKAKRIERDEEIEELKTSLRESHAENERLKAEIEKIKTLIPWWKKGQI